MNTQAIWFAVREQLADLRIEINTGVAEAAAIPWELMLDPQSDSAIALRVQSFVRVQSNPNIRFVSVPAADEGRVRLLYVVCRPGGRNDVELRAVANRLLQDLGEDLARFDITALRPPTFERLQEELTDAKAAGRPFVIGFAIPKEGAVLAVDNFVIHKAARRPDLAHRFIDFMLQAHGVGPRHLTARRIRPRSGHVASALPGRQRPSLRLRA